MSKQKNSSLKAVLCGSDFAENGGILRNERENLILQKFITPRHYFQEFLKSFLLISPLLLRERLWRCPPLMQRGVTMT
jgi:hypothetical protein